MTLIDDRPRITSPRSKAAQRAIDRHAGRRAAGALPAQSWSRRKKVVDTEPVTPAAAPRPSLIERVTAVPFVVPILALIVAGMALTLWLSTKSAQDSYDLGNARAQNQSLLDQRDALKKKFESADSAPELSDKAAQLGMVPLRNPARMVVGPDGVPHVVGTPKTVSGKAPKSINPDPGDDPTARIDTSKVDDSEGLPGSPAGQQTPAPTSESPAPTAPAGPTPTAPTAPAAPAPAPSDGPGAAPAAPAPNVLPHSGAPSTNSGRNR